MFLFPNFTARMDSSGQHAVTPFTARIVFVCCISRKPAGRPCVVVSLERSEIYRRAQEGSLPEISKYSGENSGRSNHGFWKTVVEYSPYRFPPSPRFFLSAWVKTADSRNSLIQSGWAKLVLGRVVWRGWRACLSCALKNLGPVTLFVVDFHCHVRLQRASCPWMMGRRSRFTGSAMKTRVVFFGQELTFPIIKANHEPEMLKLLFQWSWLLLSYSPTFWCAVLETGNDFAIHLSRFDKWLLEALDHNPLGKKTPCCAMSQAVPADLNWNQARCGKGKLGQPVWGCKLCAKRQAPSCCHFLSEFQGLVNFLSFLECPFKFKMVKKKNSETNSKNLRISILLDEISLGGPAYFRRQTRC